MVWKSNADEAASPSSSFSRQVVVALQDAFGQNITSLSGYVLSGLCADCQQKVLTDSSVRGLVTFSLTTTAESSPSSDLGFTFSVTDPSGVMTSSLPQPLTGLILPCGEGTGYFDSDIGCIPCPADFYSLGGSRFNQTCERCPDHVVCNGGANVALEDQYWAFSTTDGGIRGRGVGSMVEDTLIPYLCPFDYCSRGGPVSLGSSYCRPGSNRDSQSPLCGSCVVGFSEWNGRCLECRQPSADAVVTMLFKMWAFAVFTHVLA